MKKRFLSIILSLLLFVPCMFLFTACGQDNGVHLLYAGPLSEEAKDPGLLTMRVNYIAGTKEEMDGLRNPDGELPEGGENEEPEQPHWTNKSLSLNTYDKVTFVGGDVFLAHIVLVLNTGYEIGDLKVFLDEKEYEPSLVQGDGLHLTYSLGYKLIEKTTILTFEGQTKPIEYTFNIGLINYNSFKDSERFSDLRFSGVIRNVPIDGTAPTVKKAFTYNDKTEFKPDEFVEALKNTPITYFEDLVVSMYFKNRDKIIPQFSAPWEEDNQNPPNFFTNFNDCWYWDDEYTQWTWTDDLEYKLKFDRNTYSNSINMHLNFSALSFLTLEEMTYVSAIGDYSFNGDMPTDALNAIEGIKNYEQSFILTIDGQETEVSPSTFADLRKSTNTKIKIKVPKVLADIIDTDAVGIYTVCSDINEWQKELDKATCFSRESISNDVNKEYIIIDIGDIKPYKLVNGPGSNKILIGFNIAPNALLSEMKTLKIKKSTNTQNQQMRSLTPKSDNIFIFDVIMPEETYICITSENIDYKFFMNYLPTILPDSLTKYILKVTKADGTIKEYTFNIGELYNPEREEMTKTLIPAEIYSDLTFERGYFDAEGYLENGDITAYENYINQFEYYFSFDHTYGEIAEIELYEHWEEINA